MTPAAAEAADLTVTGDARLPGSWAAADSGWRVVRRALVLVGAWAGVVAALVLAALRLPSAHAAEMWRAGAGPLALASLLIPLAGLAGAAVIGWARRRAAAEPVPVPPARRWRRWLRPGARGDALLIGRAARLPQALTVAPVALAALLCAVMPRATGGAAVADICFTFGGALFVLSFPLLIAERGMAATAAAVLPEAGELRGLLLVPVLVWPLLGALEIAAGLGLSYTEFAARWIGVALALVAAEQAVRAVLVLFLPPPAPAEARAATRSWIVGLLAEAADSRGNLAAPIRAHFGIDFARSWALAYVRAALPAVALMLLAFCWALSGVVLVGQDRRAVHERFGAPVAVLAPGAHMILPWPLGAVRWVDYGTLHDVSLGDAEAGPVVRIAAEAVPPASVDRLWEQAHPAEVMLLIASESTSQQTDQKQAFQAVSLDMRVIWRVGMTDADALRIAYRAGDPQALVQGAAGRAATQFFAAHTLDDVLGENRLAIAAQLRADIQARLTPFDSGIELVAVVIEAIHPPSGAADAYHGVQAAQIAANASIESERGRAQGVRAAALQSALDHVNTARGNAAAELGQVRAERARFVADRAAARVGGESFLLTRYFAAMTGALARAPLTILDHRVDAPDAPVLDIRPPQAAVAPAGGAGGE